MKDVFISPTTIDYLQSCWRKYFLAKKRRLTTFKKPARMERGTVGHAFHAHYYREIGLNLNREAKRSLNDIIEEASVKATEEALTTDLEPKEVDAVLDLCRLYLDHYSNDNWVPMLDDKGQPLVEVPLTKLLYERPDDADGLGGIRVIFNGKIDLILPPGKGVPVRIVDHKFKDRFSELSPLDNQLALYAAVTGIPDVIRNDIGGQKEGNPNKFRRQPWKYQQSQMEENAKWAVYWALEADYHETVDIWEPNPTSCDKFGGCVFLKVCATIPDGREGVINANYKTGEAFSLYRKEGDREPAATAAPVVEEATPPVSGLREPEQSDSVGEQDGGHESAEEPVQEAPASTSPPSGSPAVSSLPSLVQEILAGKGIR